MDTFLQVIVGIVCFLGGMMASLLLIEYIVRKRKYVPDFLKQYVEMKKKQ